LEYGQTSCAAFTSASAWSRASAGIATSRTTAKPNARPTGPRLTCAVTEIGPVAIFWRRAT
jgi:hypothetical protein